MLDAPRALAGRPSLWPSLVLTSLLGAQGAAPPAKPDATHPAASVALFDGRTLDGWSGDASRWTVEDGELVGRTTAEAPLRANTFLIHEGVHADFELTLEFRIAGGNSGVQYRSRDLGNHVVAGYQADIDAARTYTGILYDEKGRGIVARRGEHVVWPADGDPTRQRFAPDAELQAHISAEQWNRYRIVAFGPRVEHYLNDALMVVVEDHAAAAAASGHIALQLHVGAPMEVRFREIRLRALTTAPAWRNPGELRAQRPDVPHWIWAAAETPDGARAYLQHSFSVPAGIQRGELVFACDNHAVVYLDGARIGTSDDWAQPTRVKLPAASLTPGLHHLAVEARNDGGPAGFLLRLALHAGDGTVQHVVSHPRWRAAAELADPATELWRTNPPRAWHGAHDFGPVGTPPWGDPLAPRRAPDPAEFSIADGLAVELVYSAQPGDGSWVSMAFDPDGHLIVCPQSGGLRRLHWKGDQPWVEELDTPVHSSQGMLFDGRDLLAQVSVGKKAGGGLHRLEDRDGDGTFEGHAQLRAFDAGGEHGAHGIVRGPEGDVWLVQGNYTEVAQPVDADAPFRNWAEDVLTERLFDPRGHAKDVRMPAGRILQTDDHGKKWRLYAGGMRNPYDLVFGPDGELFTFDADMEWDLGAPWYRPTRVLHIVSGGEYGWRSGAAKWPSEYPDSLPAVVDIGPGSPTGIAYREDNALPAAWRRALFLGDWTFGRILAVHLQARGASYSGTEEIVVEGRGLTITDLAFGPGGDLWFLTGGRGTQTGVYRIHTAEGARDAAAVATGVADAADDGARQLRALRRRLEALHGRDDAAGLDVAWPHLDHADRFVRFAARTAIEHRAPDLWRERALSDPRPTARLTAALALARADSIEHRVALLQALAAEPWGERTPQQRLLLARVAMVHFARHGLPPSVLAAPLRRTFSAAFPSGDPVLDGALLELLVALDEPGVLARALDVLESSEDEAFRMQVAYVARTAKRGWNSAEIDRFITWVRQAVQQEGGLSLIGYVRNIAGSVRPHMSEADLARLDAALRGEAPEARDPSTLRTWTMEDLEGILTDTSARDPDAGRRAYASAQCASCHRFGTFGGRVGPDLTGVAKRFSREQILTSLLEPSRDISDQYRNTEVRLRDGTALVGRVLAEDASSLTIELDPFTGAQRKVPLAEVLRRDPSKVSPMPADLLGYLDRDQILDLLAFLEN